MNNKKKQTINRIVIIVLLAAVAAYFYRCKAEDSSDTIGTELKAGVVEVHFIDVGQGDSILIETENAAMLIDAGENNKGNTVVDYLKSRNITRLDYVIGTHPHSDHIGGLDTVLDAIPAATVIMPQVSNTTRTFEDVLDAVERNDLRIKKPVVGDEYGLGQAYFTIIAPNSSDYEDINDCSICIKLTNGSNSFLFTGDAGIPSEEEMLAENTDISADVLKLAHHGSSSAGSYDFLNAVDPVYAVISVGKDNEYGHPHDVTLQAVKERNIKLYRTDLQGTVVFTSDGTNISVNMDQVTD